MAMGVVLSKSLLMIAIVPFGKTSRKRNLKSFHRMDSQGSAQNNLGLRRATIDRTQRPEVCRCMTLPSDQRSRISDESSAELTVQLVETRAVAFEHSFNGVPEVVRIRTLGAADCE